MFAGDSAIAAWVRKTASFFEFSLCLSRACLDKMIVYIYKWLKNAVFRRDRRANASTPTAQRSSTGGWGRMLAEAINREALTSSEIWSGRLGFGRSNRRFGFRPRQCRRISKETFILTAPVQASTSYAQKTL